MGIFKNIIAKVAEGFLIIEGYLKGLSGKQSSTELMPVRVRVQRNSPFYNKRSI